jgi:hypothetical protein
MTPDQSRTAEHELRIMIGDLFMQIAMLRAELASRPPAPQPQANGKDTEDPDADHRPLAS